MKVTTPPPPPSGALPPVAKAGADQTITLPLDSVVLDASGSYDPDGKIASYLWTQIGGPQANIKTSDKAQTVVTNLKQGRHSFH